jgi:hypothetical protein
MLDCTPRRRRAAAIGIAAIVLTGTLAGCNGPGPISGSITGRLATPSAAQTPTPRAEATPRRPQHVTGRDISSPEPGLEEQQQRLLPQLAAPGGAGGYAFLSTDQQTPTRWDPCRPIHYAIRDKNTPPGGDELIREVVKEVSGATGLAFIEDPPTDEVPSLGRQTYLPVRYGDRWAPLLIAWSDSGEVPTFGPAAIGITSPQAFTRTAGAGAAYVSGWVYLDAPAMAAEDASWNSTWPSRAIIRHELAHAVGLDHTTDSTELMYAKNQGQPGYAAGDLRGLAIAGAGKCHPEI